MVWRDSVVYNFLDFTQSAPWFGRKSYDNFYIKKQNGFEIEKYQILVGTYFFLSDEYVEYNLNV